MYNYLLGFTLSLICSTLVLYSTFGKNKKEIAKIQTYDQVFNSLSNFFLCSYSAVVIGIINTMRNYLISKNRLTTLISILCIIFYITFGYAFNNIGLIGIFPIMASSSYVLFCLLGKSAQSMRYGLIVNQVLWFFHDIYVKAYPAVTLEILVVSFCVYNIVKDYIKGRKNKK